MKRVASSTHQPSAYRVSARNHLDAAAAQVLRDQVARLCRNGFRALPLPNLFAKVDGLYLYRPSANGYIDTIVIRSADCAVAARVRDRFDPADPLPEDAALWSTSGELDSVVDKVFGDLRDERDRRGAMRHSGHLGIQQS
ncbi:hypothetical protein [Alloactinosynnema sp. L-07]|uniref:hypothetical protein n=1 Tax=Alloactinosynnema sp. L-07 TaxID=1653480 RepID=UPI00065EEFD9|nr:hypothetical protein [Alloactinosynnema sp. L-07]CRK55465.1 hypothetical protein [Alloactinosynnema sp. L-07]